LLGTDLSARGDRALDRATQLATAWNAELLVVHAVEGEGHVPNDLQGLPSWRRGPDGLGLIERQIREDIRGPCPGLRVQVEEGPAVQVILDAIRREGCDFVVLGQGRRRPLGGVGKTIDELFRRSPVSVLVVKRRPNGPYNHVLVGTDFSEEARRGLEVASRLFSDAMFTVLHAYEAPYGGLLVDSQFARDLGEMERATMRSFLEEADLPGQQRNQIVALIEHGPPEAMLGAYVVEQGANLTVIGAYERSRLFHVVIGGKGPRIMEAVPSDVLVVRAERPAKPAPP
jgi:nucleotide-binding universal stress UspA family protein